MAAPSSSAAGDGGEPMLSGLLGGGDLGESGSWEELSTVDARDAGSRTPFLGSPSRNAGAGEGYPGGGSDGGDSGGGASAWANAMAVASLHKSLALAKKRAAECEARAGELESENEALTTRLDDQEKRLSRVRADNEELRTENARLRAAMQLSQRAQDGAAGSTTAADTSVFQQTKEAREENARLRQALEAAEEVNAQLRERLDEAHHMRPSAQQSLASMQRILEDTLAEKNILFDELSRLRATLSRMYEQQTTGFLVTTKLRAVAQGNALLCVLRRQRRTLLVRGMNALKYTSAAGQLSRNFNVLASAASILARRQFPHLTGSALVPCWKAWKQVWLQRRQAREEEMHNQHIVRQLRARMNTMTKNRLFHRWAHNTAFRAKARNALFRIVGIATRRAFFAWRRHVKVLKETEMEAAREEATTRGATLSEELEITSGMLVKAQARAKHYAELYTSEHRRRLLAGCVRPWLARWRAEKLAHQRLIDTIVRLKYEAYAAVGTRRVFEAWRDMVRRDRRLDALTNHLLAKRRARQQRRALDTWHKRAHLQRRIAAVVAKLRGRAIPRLRHTVFRAWADYTKQRKAVGPIVTRMLMSRRSTLVAGTFHAWRRFVSACRLERMQVAIDAERERRVGEFVKRWRAWGLARVLHAWREVVVEDKRNAVIVKRVVARMQQGALVRCFAKLAVLGRRRRAKKEGIARLHALFQHARVRFLYRHWVRVCIGEKDHEVGATIQGLQDTLLRFRQQVNMSNRRIAEKLYKAWKVALLRQCFRCWLTLHQDRLKALKAMRWFTGLRVKRTQIRILRAWREATVESLRVKEIGRRIMMRLMNQTVARTFTCWKSYTINSKHEKQIIAQFAARWRNRFAWGYFLRWSRYASRKVEARATADTMFHNQLRLLQARVFKAWSQQVSRQKLAEQQDEMDRQMEAQLMAKARHVLARIMNNWKSMCFYAWRDSVREEKHNREVIAKFAFRMKYNGVMRAFDRWQSKYRARQRVRQLLRSILSGGGQRDLRGAFTRWAAHVRMAAKYEVMEQLASLQRQMHEQRCNLVLANRARADRMYNKQRKLILKHTFSSWQLVFRRASRDAHQVRWFRHLRERRVIRRVFGTLRKYASRRGLILRIVRRLTRRLRTEAFLRWKDWVTGRTKVEAIVHQFILRRQHSMKQRVFAALSRSIHDSKMEAMQAQMMSQLQTQQMARMRAMLARVQKGSQSYTFTLWRDNTREIRRQRRVVTAFAFKMKHASVMRLFTLWRDNARYFRRAKALARRVVARACNAQLAAAFSRLRRVTAYVTAELKAEAVRKRHVAATMEAMFASTSSRLERVALLFRLRRLKTKAFRGWTAYSLRYKRQRLAVTRWRVGLLRKFLAHMRTKYSRRVGFLRWARNVSAGGILPAKMEEVVLQVHKQSASGFRRLTSVSSVSKLFAAVHDVLFDMFEGANSCAFVVDTTRGEMWTVTPAHAKHRVSQGTGLAGAAAASKAPIHVANAALDARYSAVADLAVVAAGHAPTVLSKPSTGAGAGAAASGSSAPRPSATDVSAAGAAPAGGATGVVCLCMPCFDPAAPSGSAPVALIQLARQSPDLFSDVECAQVESFGNQLAATVQRLSRAAARRTARKQAQHSLGLAKAEFSKSQGKVAELTVVKEAREKELALVLKDNQVMRDRLKRTVSTQRVDLERTSTYVSQLEQEAQTAVHVKTQNKDLQVALVAKHGELETTRSSLHQLKTMLAQKETQSETWKQEMQVRVMEQYHHEKAILAADNTSLRNELVRAQTDLTFLSGAVREMVEHDGRISRTRLNEAVRICEHVDVKDAAALGSSRLRRPGTPVPAGSKGGAVSPSQRFQGGPVAVTARDGINGGTSAPASGRRALLLNTSAGGSMSRAMNGGTPRRSSTPGSPATMNGGRTPTSVQGNGW